MLVVGVEAVGCEVGGLAVVEKGVEGCESWFCEEGRENWFRGLVEACVGGCGEKDGKEHG